MNSMLSDAVLFGEMYVWLKPLWIDAAFAGIAVFALLAAFYTLRFLFPQAAAIAQVTTKEAISQPLFLVLMLIGFFSLFIFLFLPYNTFGEDIIMVKSTGLTVIKLLAMILVIWTASVSISEEIEGKTALMVLSKPVSRWQFILGKLSGVIIPAAILFIVLGTFFLGSISYKLVYDARESAAAVPNALQCYAQMIQVMPGLILFFMETIVLGAIAVMISTRLPMIPNLMICMTIYLLGHLIPVMVNSSVGELPFVAFVGSLIAAVLPVLDHFNIETSISTGQIVPPIYLLWSGLYCLLYTGVAMVLALLLFEDRDLA